jgi:hypothetical protein
MLIINDQHIDLGSQKLSTTYQQNDPQNLTTRISSYSNTLTIPPTQNNLNILGLPTNLNSRSDIPYAANEAQYLSNGLVIFKGFASVVRCSASGIQLNLFDNTIDFFEAIKDRLISQLSFSGSIDFDAAGQDGYRNTTSGIVAPVIQYGKYNTGTNNITEGYNVPSIYYHSVIEKIITDAGYDFDGSIFDHDHYNKLIIPWSRDNFEYGDSFADDRSFLGDYTISPVGQGFALNASGQTQVITFDKILRNGDESFWNAISNEYDVPALDYTFGAVIKLNGEVDIGGITATSLLLGIRFNGSFTANVSISSTGVTSFSIETTLITFGGSPVVIDAVVQQQGAGSIGGTVANITSLEVQVSKIIDINSLAIGYCLPDITQTDLIADFVIRFNLLVKESEGTLYFKSVDEVLDDIENSVDWTNKRDTTIQDDIDFKPDYAQNNYFRYGKNDDLVTEYTGEGNFDIDNDGLEESREYYTSQFNSTYDELVGTIRMAHIPLYTVSVTPREFDNAPGLRLLMVRDRYTSEPSVTYNVTPRSDYLVAYFEDSQQDYDCTYRSFLATHYNTTKSSYQKYKSVSRVYVLNEIDIHTLDMFRLIFDNGIYFMINSIKNYIAGQKAKVQLLKK